MTNNITITQEDNIKLMARYPDNYFDLAIVDPPYRDKNTPTKQMREKTNGRMVDFGLKPSPKYWRELFRVSKNQIVWGGNNFLEHLHSTNCFIFWDKLQSMDNYSDGELAWTSFNSVARQFRYVWSGNRYGTPDNIKGVGKPSCRKHPTEKPVALYEWTLRNYAKEGDRILDTHYGRGAIGLACHDGHFELVACEIDEDYYKDSTERLKRHQAQGSLF